MAKKEISVVIRARNAMAAGLAAAGKSLQSFGKSALNIGKMFATSFLAAGTAVVGFGVKALQAFSVQEKATKEAEAALRAYGDEVPKNIENIKRFSAAIQDETGANDEAMVARAAKLRMLGVEADQLEAATKATVALASAGMEESAAVKAVAAAMDGNFEQLTRYLPALKSATTEAEKAQIVNDFLTRGYAQQKDTLNTVAGQWGALKGRIGDVWEEVGAAIAQQGVLTDGLKRAGDAVKAFGARIAEWVAEGGASRMIETFKLFAVNVRETFDQVGAYAQYGVDNAMEAVKWFGRAASTVFKNVAGVVKATWENATDQAGYFLAKLHAKVTGQEWNLQPPQMKDIMAGVDAVPERTKAAAIELDKELAAIAAKRAEREKAIADAAIKQVDKKKAIEEQAAVAEVAAQEKIEVARLNPLKMLEDEIELAKKKMAIHGEMAKKTIADILAEQKAREDAAKAWGKDVKRAQELRARQARGVKLGKKDAEWLAAFGQIEGARKGIGAAAGQIGAAQKQLAQMKDQGKKLVDIKDELAKVHKDLNNLLQRE